MDAFHGKTDIAHERIALHQKGRASASPFILFVNHTQWFQHSREEMGLNLLYLTDLLLETHVWGEEWTVFDERWLER